MPTRVNSNNSVDSRQSTRTGTQTTPTARRGGNTTINAGSKPKPAENEVQQADQAAQAAPASRTGTSGTTTATRAAAAEQQQQQENTSPNQRARNLQRSRGLSVPTFGMAAKEKEAEKPQVATPVTTPVVPVVDAEAIESKPKKSKKSKKPKMSKESLAYYSAPSRVPDGRDPARKYDRWDNLVDEDYPYDYDPDMPFYSDAESPYDIDSSPEYTADEMIWRAPNGSVGTRHDVELQAWDRRREEEGRQRAREIVDLMRGTTPEQQANARIRQRTLSNARQKIKDDIRENLINIGMRQRLGLSARQAMDRINSRFRTVDSYVTTPSKGSDREFKFVEDDALNPKVFPAEASDKEMLDRFRRDVERFNSNDIGEIKNRRESPETSLDAQRNGYVEFDPSSTESDVIRNTNRSIDQTAMIMANPLLVKVEGMHFDRVAIEGDTRFIEGKLRWSNKKGRDVEGAIGLVRRKYGCSTMSVLRLVYGRLGLSVDTHGKICGKSIEEFELPATIFIEACNDIVTSQDECGIPNAIVSGIPGGFDGHSRDDTGMFPVLGGTRCYPLGMINVSTFEDISRDPNSPLHGMSATDFYTKCADEWINQTQRAILANTDGPLAYQAAALNTAMRAVMSIDGFALNKFNISEQEIFRTRSQIQAQRMEAGDKQVQEAFDAKMELMPTVLDRWSRMNFKDGGARSNGSEGDVKGAFACPGEINRKNMLDNFLNRFNDVANVVHTLWLEIMLTGPIEGAVSTAQQQVVVTMQNMYKGFMNKKGVGNRFDKTDYLKSVMNQDDAIEAIDTMKMLFRIGGRTAVDAFRFDRNDTNTGTRYHITKADAMDFLQRWGASQGSEVMDRINKMTSMFMIGDGMFKKTKSQQFLDMALFEMALQDTKGTAEVLDNADLEEIARAGAMRNGAGEALVSALMDTTAGYEAFKTMDATSLSRTNPATRATQIVLQKNGVVNTAVRSLIGRFPEYGIGWIARAMPLSNTVSYMISNLVKMDAMTMSEATEVTNSFSRGFKDVTEAMSRISDYQIGMDSVDFMSGLYKNLAYDVVTFGANYVLTGALIRSIIELLGGLEPPDDPKKKTLASEWKIRGLGVPIKAAWFMDDLVGCGLPFAYAWMLSDGWDEYDDEGNVVRHVEGGSSEATGVASSVFINTVAGFMEGNFVIDAIDFVNNFDKNFNEAMHTDIADVVREHYKDNAANMSDDELRREWLASRAECILWDLFGDLTPPILREILPGGRDSLFGRDGYVHSTNKKYDENYDRETAENEWRTTGVTYAQHERMLRTMNNPIAAFIADWLNARDGVDYQYQNMPIDLVQDPRNLGDGSYESLFSLPLTLKNGSPNLDLTGPDGVPDGKTDTQEERQSYLFGRAEEVCNLIYDDYVLADGYPEMAVVDGLYIPADARLNAINYCYYMQTKIKDEISERKKNGYIPEEEYQALWDEVDKYKTILYDYLNNEDIPWRAPRYAHLETDKETMYIDSQGNATNALDSNAQRLRYEYGNDKGLAPFLSPRDTGMIDYDTRLWDIVLDENGNPMNDLGKIWDQAERAGTITSGRWENNNVLEQMANGLGPHNTDLDEQLLQQRGDLITLGYRSYEPFEGTYPDWLKNPDADTIAKMLGVASYVPDEDGNIPSTTSSSSSDGSSYSGGSSYYSSSYSGGGGGGGGYYSGGYSSSYSSAYNPKIYSTAKQVYGDRASGMQTRQPYNATTTYLRPNFYTKGSREAYKRSDI